MYQDLLEACIYKIRNLTVLDSQNVSFLEMWSPLPPEPPYPEFIALKLPPLEPQPGKPFSNKQKLKLSTQI